MLFLFSQLPDLLDTYCHSSSSLSAHALWKDRASFVSYERTYIISTRFLRDEIFLYLVQHQFRVGGSSFDCILLFCVSSGNKITTDLQISSTYIHRGLWMNMLGVVSVYMRAFAYLLGRIKLFSRAVTIVLYYFPLLFSVGEGFSASFCRQKSSSLYTLCLALAQ